MSEIGNLQQLFSSEPEVGMDKPVKTYSCNRCTSKKIRCNKLSPCSNCLKKDVECTFEARAPPQRRRRLIGTETAQKLQQQSPIGTPARVRVNPKLPEHPLLLSNGVSSQQPSGISPRGRLVPEKGGHIYLESNLWAALGDQAQASEQNQTTESEMAQTTSPYPAVEIDVAALIFGAAQNVYDLKTLRPPPLHMFRLWQVFLDNVNPLCKVIHVPTLQKRIFTECAVGNMTCGMEALMFSIYSTAVQSMTPEACMEIFQEQKSNLMIRYHTGAQKAFANSQFLRSSDLGVLQAFSIYLISVREVADPQTMWSLCGLATRFAQRIGVHRDGSSLGLSIFETEMRRRLWLQLKSLEHRASEVARAGRSIIKPASDVQAPLNVNDSELDPEMQQPPMEHTGMTEMGFCRLRWELSAFFERAVTAMSDARSYDGDWGLIGREDVPLAEKDKLLDEFESLLRTQFINHCDNVVPLHLITSVVAETVLCKLRLMARHPRMYPDKHADMPLDEKKSLFENSVRLLELSNILQSSKITQKFMWHVKTYFQAEGVLQVLNELGYRFSGVKVDHAWRQIDELFLHHPHLLTDKKTLYVALRRLTAATWTTRCNGLSAVNQSIPPAPPNVAILLTQSNQETPSDTNHSRNTFQNSGHESREANLSISQQPTIIGAGNTFLSSGSMDATNLPFNSSSIDWMYWEGLIQGHQTDTEFNQYYFQSQPYHNYSL